MTEFLKQIDENTPLTIKFILPIMLTIISATIWIQSTLARIEGAQRDYITRAAVVEWRNQFADHNLNLNVPHLPSK